MEDYHDMNMQCNNLAMMNLVLSKKTLEYGLTGGHFVLL